MVGGNLQGTQAFMTQGIKVNKGDTIHLSIEKLVYGGRGLAHHGTRACLVDGVIPGESIVARVEEIKRHYLVASCREIRVASPYRCVPPCPITRDCGGCQWQHISYEHQLLWKTNILRECLERIAGIEELSIEEPLPSPLAFNYRCRATLKVRADGEPAIGYFKEGTHKLVPVPECMLLAAPLNRALAFCWRLLHTPPTCLQGVDELQMVLVNESQQVILQFAQRGTGKAAKYILKEEAVKSISCKGTLLEKLFDLSFKRDVNRFYQVNFHQNLRVIQMVSEYFAPLKGEEILDLYCGSGNFSLFLAQQGAQVTGIDSDRQAIEEARYNAALNRIDHCNFVRADLNTLSPYFFHKDVAGVLLNPPRGGCTRGVLKAMVALHPKIVVYVSCNPTTLARDLGRLISAGYHLSAIQPVDMFPQTYHIETIVKLTR